MSIGSYGEKATPVFGQNKLEVKDDHIPAPKLSSKITKVSTITLDGTASSETDFTSTVSGKILVVGFTGNVSEVYDGLVKERLKLVWFAVEENAMKDAINSSPKVRDDLRNFDGDARAAHQIFVAMEASWANSFSGATNFNLSADATGILSITASGGTSIAGKNRISLSPGTTLAYLLLKFDWNKDKSQITDTHGDECGVN